MKGTPGDDVSSPIMFIGEAPGTRDDFDGQQFVGQVGELLWSAAKKVGIPIDQVYTQNAVRCNPPNNKLNGMKAVNACRTFLYEEIDKVRPRAILVLGAKAFQSLFKKGGGLNKSRRTKLQFALSDGTLVPTAAAYHPAFVIRNRNLKENFEHDIKFFAEMLTGKEKAFSVQGANLDASEKDLLALQRRWARQKISIAGPDCEGNTLKPYRDKDHAIVMCVSLSDGTPSGTVVVRLDTVVKPYMNAKNPGEYKLIANDDPKVLALKAILEDPNIGKVNHNIKHDMHVLWCRFGIEIANVVNDTLIHHALIYPMESKHDLDEVASELLGIPKYKHAIEKFIGTGEAKKNPRRYERIPIVPLCLYAASDALATYKVHRRLLREDAKLASIYRDLNLPGMMPGKFMKTIAIPGMIALYKMERRGIRINQKKTTALIDDLTTRLAETERELRALPTVMRYELRQRKAMRAEIAKRKRPPTDAAKRILLEKNRLNVNSGDQLNTIIFAPEYFGVPEHLGTLTEGETRYKTSAEELARIVREAAVTAMPEEKVNELEKFCTLCVQYSTFTKLRGTFASPLLEQFVDSKSRVHSTFNLGIARTGRLSSSDPNLQNIPSHDDDDPNRRGLYFRNLYIAPKNYVLMCPDYSQIELRILAAISGDEGMIDIYRQGYDLHAETARAIYGIKPGKEIKDQQRRHAKTINFGVVYGLGAEGLSRQLGISFEEAQLFIDRWFERFPGVYEWQQRTKAFATKYGFVYTMFGRRRLLADARETSYSDEFRSNRNEALRQAINAPVQGTASDVCLTALTALDKAFDKLSEMLGIYLAGNVSTVHDQILMEVRESKVMSTARVAKRIMTEHPLKFIGDQMHGVPIVVDFKVGKSWGEAKTLEVAA